MNTSPNQVTPHMQNWNQLKQLARDLSAENGLFSQDRLHLEDGYKVAIVFSDSLRRADTIQAENGLLVHHIERMLASIALRDQVGLMAHNIGRYSDRNISEAFVFLSRFHQGASDFRPVHLITLFQILEASGDALARYQYLQSLADKISGAELFRALIQQAYPISTKEQIDTAIHNLISNPLKLWKTPVLDAVEFIAPPVSIFKRSLRIIHESNLQRAAHRTVIAAKKTGSLLATQLGIVISMMKATTTNEAGFDLTKGTIGLAIQSIAPIAVPSILGDFPSTMIGKAATFGAKISATKMTTVASSKAIKASSSTSISSEIDGNNSTPIILPLFKIRRANVINTPNGGRDVIYDLYQPSTMNCFLIYLGFLEDGYNVHSGSSAMTDSFKASNDAMNARLILRSLLGSYHGENCLRDYTPNMEPHEYVCEMLGTGETEWLSFDIELDENLKEAAKYRPISYLRLLCVSAGVTKPHELDYIEQQQFKGSWVALRPGTTAENTSTSIDSPEEFFANKENTWYDKQDRFFKKLTQEEVANPAYLVNGFECLPEFDSKFLHQSLLSSTKLKGFQYEIQANQPPEHYIKVVRSSTRWIDDTEATQCFICSSRMMFGRRHHCRCCGQIFCGDHVKQSALILDPDTQLSKHYICTNCERYLKNIGPAVAQKGFTMNAGKDDPNRLALRPGEKIFRPLFNSYRRA